MPLQTGGRLGPYVIVAPLGAGGMGEVFRAHDSRLGRDVALKVLPDGFAGDAERLARFEREARTVAGLNHPNIVTLFSIEEDGGTRFLTMELVEGRTLDGLLANGGLPLAKVLDVAIPLADALVAAHGRGVIHRDLKPANVMVAEDGRVKVLDFGLAKATRPASSPVATQALTMASPISGVGMVLGTVPYMAPEQVRGEAADARTDVFAFGILLYELATGRRPFEGATLADLSSAILRDAPKPPLAEVRADLPRGFDGIVRRCLEKAPEDRYSDASQLLQALRELRATLDAAGRVGDASPSIAVLPFRNMSADPENEYFSDGLTEELLNVLARNAELKVAGRTSSFAFKDQHEDLRAIGRKLGVRTLLEGSVRKAGSRVRITAQLINAEDGFHLWSNTYDRVLDDIFAVQDDIAQAVASALQVTLLSKRAPARPANGEAYERLLRANHFTRMNTGTSLVQAVTLYREVIERDPENARAWAGLAKAYVNQAFYGHGDVATSHRLAREAAERAQSLDDLLADAHLVMSWILMSLEFRWNEGMVSLRRALALAPGSSEVLMTMGVYLGAFGQLEDGLPLLEKAVAIDPLDPNGFLHRARLEGWARDEAKVEVSLARALELSPDMAVLHALRGLALLKLKRPDEALAEIRKENSLGYRNWALAIAFAELGDRAASDAALAQLISAGDQWAFQFASAQAARGEVDEAFSWLERAFELHDTGVVLTKMSPHFDNLRGDPRWPRFLEKIGLAD